MMYLVQNYYDRSIIDYHRPLMTPKSPNIFSLPLSHYWIFCIFPQPHCYVYSVFFIFGYCYCWTVKSDNGCQLIPPVHKVSFLSFLLVSGLAMLCHHMVAYHPCPQRSRETGTVFQSLKLIQTVSHCC